MYNQEFVSVLFVIATYYIWNEGISKASFGNKKADSFRSQLIAKNSDFRQPFLQ